jgi:aspartate racemase
MKIIGVLGGMGPESTALFYRRLITQCQSQYGAKQDEDYPEIFIYNLPIPDPVRGIKETETRASLVSGIKKLESIGVDLIAVPCNTIQYFINDMRKTVSIPVIGIIEETVKEVKGKKIGLLATTPTVKNKLYSEADLIVPKKSEQIKINQIICQILAGKLDNTSKLKLMQFAKLLKSRGADAIVIGCTDLSVVDELASLPYVIDSLNILAEKTIESAAMKTDKKKQGEVSYNG